MSLEPVTPESNVTAKPSVTRNGSRPLTNAERQRAHRERQRAKKLQPESSAKPPRPGGHKLRRLDPNKPKRPVTPTPRLHAPPPTDQRFGDYPHEIIDDILRRVSHGETLTQACNSNPDYPHPASIIDWTIEDPAGMGQRYARARDRQLEAWADQIVIAADEAVRNPATAPGARLGLDARKFLLSKLKPQVYGDHAKIDLTSAGQPLQAASSLDLAKALATALQARALPAPVIEVEATEVPVEPEGERS